MGLKEELNKYKILCSVIDEYKEPYKLLLELKQRRESALRPADKYLTNTIPMQLDHIESELDEVKQEIYNYMHQALNVEQLNKVKSHLCEELVDLQMSCETMLTILDLNEEERMTIKKYVIKKNNARRYYDKDGD